MLQQRLYHTCRRRSGNAHRYTIHLQLFQQRVYARHNAALGYGTGNDIVQYIFSQLPGFMAVIPAEALVPELCYFVNA
ncbi:hypothetical protein D3C86_1520860 [compost metagenome]